MSVSFDKRLAELDAYLQMLIVESESIDRKVDNISSSTTNINGDAEREGLLNIKNNLETLLGSIKHSIVLLQIAKVSLKTLDSSTGNESPSTTTTPPPPTRPARPSKSASSTPSSNENNIARLKKNQVHNSRESITGLASPDNKSPYQLQQKKQHQQQSQSLSNSSATAATPDTVLNVESALHHRSKFNTVTADDYGCSGFGGSGNNSSCDGVNVAAHHANAAITATLSSGEKLTASSSTRCHDNDGNSVEEEDDDDAFFDAADEQHSKSIITPACTEATPTSMVKNKNNNIDSATRISSLVNDRTELQQDQELPNQADIMPRNTETNNNIAGTLADGSIDWDALYEDEDEEDLGSLESQGSVIKHLLSQIRIGMDLTKVVLPTFILERRSLLEMYADFFAHPDLFSQIPEYNTPEERMVQLVRWYLSAFHAGRKSSVAKKPYNPILGEIFRCRWHISDSNTNIQHQVKATNDNDGQELTFIAEQVSHHPPVSAFYAENKKKLISCCAHIYTKSKYLGLSVGVHNIGQGVITLSSHKESYVCTFPSAYGRSILTVPWVELGGPVNIVCNETGYRANIEFVTKPFYGGKKHRVMGEILRPNNEPFLTIDGEWNGIMYNKSPPNSNDKQVFVDTTSLPVIKKRVEPVTTQESFESRNVWKEVTRALKLQDITTATAAKSFIEQRQRDLLKDRLENGVKWRTRYFEACDDGWVYSTPCER